MGMRYWLAFLAVGLLGGLDSSFGQCPAECPAAGREVIVVASWATIRPEFCERILADVKPGPDGLRRLTDREVARFLEASQGDPRACVMMAPKITVNDGQPATVCVTDRTSFITGLKAVRVGTDNVCIPQREQVETGNRLVITPKTSADGRFIRLAIDAERKTLGPCSLVPVMTQLHATGTDEPLPFTQYLQVPRVNTQKLKAVAVVPVGGAVLVPGPIVSCEARTEFRIPVLSEIPYVSELFTSFGMCRESEQAVLIVSARLVPESVAALPVEMPAAAPAGKPMLWNGQGIPAARVMPAGHTERTAAGHEIRNVAALMKAYHRACAAGDKEAAMRLAVQALALDPTCFGSRK